LEVLRVFFVAAHRAIERFPGGTSERVERQIVNRKTCMPLFQIDEVATTKDGRAEAFRMHLVEADSYDDVRIWCRDNLRGKIERISQLPPDTVLNNANRDA
jgi:hypothetical protein